MIYEIWEDRKSRIKKIKIKDRVYIIHFRDKKLKWLLKNKSKKKKQKKSDVFIFYKFILVSRANLLVRLMKYKFIKI